MGTAGEQVTSQRGYGAHIKMRSRGSCLKLSGAVLSRLEIFEAVWSFLELSEAVWGYLELPGTVRSCLELFAAVWGCFLELS